MTSCVTGVCGTGDWNGPQPGDPDVSNSILTATPAFGGIDVTWTYPGLNPNAVAHTILYRGTSPEFYTVTKQQVVAGNFFYDKVDDNQTYYYWIKIVSIYGTEGGLIGPASATAKPLIEDMIERLTGQIDNGALSTTLKAKLDEISTLNANLLNEITARENAEITLAQAIAAADAQSAQALNFIAEEVNTRATADSAAAEQLNLVASTLEGQVAAVVTRMGTEIDTVNGTIGAMYTAQVTVNGLVGGFGIYNDGDTVEAGFDVDRFWVGRTSGDKRKPFIIDGGVVYIDEGAINKLTFSKLRDEAGNFVVENGKVKADYLKVSTAAIDDLAVTRAKIANLAVGNAQIDNAAITSAKIGDAQITTAKIGTGQIDTLRIAGEAVTVPASASATNVVNSVSDNWVTVLTSPVIDPQGGKTIVLATIMDWMPDNVSPGGGGVYPLYVRLLRNGGTEVLNVKVSPDGGPVLPYAIALHHLEPAWSGALWFDVQIYGTGPSAWVGKRAISVIGAKR